jgi:hypothetical protein
LVKKQKDDTFTGEVKVIFKNKNHCKKIFYYIKDKIISKFPICSRYDLQADNESNLIQASKLKRELKNKSGRGKKFRQNKHAKTSKKLKFDKSFKRKQPHHNHH